VLEGHKRLTGRGGLLLAAAVADPLGLPVHFGVEEESIPTTLGVQVMNTALAGRPLSIAWANGTLPWLLAHTVTLAAAAWLAYLYTLRRARRDGGLSP
jgi:hypothetical protein